MNYKELNNLTKKFMMGEGKETTIKAYLQSLSEIIGSLSPATKRDMHRLQVAKEHLREVNSRVRRLEQKVSLLEEELTVLKEDSNNEKTPE